MITFDELAHVATALMSVAIDVILLIAMAFFILIGSTFINTMAWAITTLLLIITTPLQHKHSMYAVANVIWQKRYEKYGSLISPIISTGVFVVMAAAIKWFGVPQQYVAVAWGLSFIFPAVLLLHFAYKVVRIRNRLPKMRTASA